MPPILTIPIDHTFLYVEPIFIQAKQARMPQLQKVALAVGDTLVYEDTYEKALASLAAVLHGHPPPAPTPSTSASGTPGTPPAASAASSRTRTERGPNAAGPNPRASGPL